MYIPPPTVLFWARTKRGYQHDPLVRLDIDWGCGGWRGGGGEGVGVKVVVRGVVRGVVGPD